MCRCFPTPTRPTHARAHTDTLLATSCSLNRGLCGRGHPTAHGQVAHGTDVIWKRGKVPPHPARSPRSRLRPRWGGGGAVQVAWSQPVLLDGDFGPGGGMLKVGSPRATLRSAPFDVQPHRTRTATFRHGQRCRHCGADGEALCNPGSWECRSPGPLAACPGGGFETPPMAPRSGNASARTRAPRGAALTAWDGSALSPSAAGS